MNERGITLIEVIITTTILCIALLPLVSIFTYGTKATVDIAKANIAMELARELMDEIKSKYWDEWNVEPPENREQAVPSSERSRVGSEEGTDDKTKFDDIDDYDGWEEDPPLNVRGKKYDGQTTYIDGTKLPDYTEYKRQVRVKYVEGHLGDPDDIRELTGNPSGRAATNGKQVTVIVSWGGDKKEERKVVTTCVLCNYSREIPSVEE